MVQTQQSNEKGTRVELELSPIFRPVDLDLKRVPEPPVKEDPLESPPNSPPPSPKGRQSKPLSNTKEFEAEKQEPKKKKGSTILFSAFTMMNNTVGPSMLTLPFAIKQGGIIPGICFLILVAIISDDTARIYTRLAEQTGYYTHKEVHNLAFKFGGVLAEVSVIVFSFGAMLARVVVMSELIPPLMRIWGAPAGAWYASSYFTAGMVVLLVFAPMSFFRRLKMLKQACAIAIAIFWLISFLVVGQGIYRLATQGMPSSVAVASPNFLGCISILFSAFFMHNNCLVIFRELRAKSVKRMYTVTHLAQIASAILFICTSLFGYLTFGADTPSNILSGYDPRSPLIMVAQIALMLAVSTSYPIWLFSMRESIDNLFFYRFKFHWVRLIIITILILCASYGVAMAVPNLQFAFGVLMGLSATYVGFSMPYICSLRVFRKTITRAQAVFTVLKMIFASALGCLSVGMNIYEIAAK
eukprot:gnl/Trimastix_PCT/997.p1 GENE.gnl/Trimastix_PCT/997~~gnl/Trimastix_PCT/997.p1  ORF type:complete len:470 (+),score=170.29 gnl/Trimastix_PCT/997:72-1481(+)